MNFIYRIHDSYKRHKLKKMGVIIGKTSAILTPDNFFGSEPYLITIGEHCLISGNVFFSCHDGATHVVNNILGSHFDKIKPIVIGNNVYIGFGSMVMGGVHIGDNVIIGGHSTVTKDIPSGVVAVGSPAKIICTVDEYIEKHKNEFDTTWGMSREEKKHYYIEKYRIGK